MRFKIDENLPPELADLLSAEGHDVASVLEEKLGGASDATLAQHCRAEERALVTLDVGFADIRSYPPESYSGLVVLRLRQHDKPHILAVLKELVPL